MATMFQIKRTYVRQRDMPSRTPGQFHKRLYRKDICEVTNVKYIGFTLIIDKFVNRKLCSKKCQVHKVNISNIQKLESLC